MSTAFTASKELLTKMYAANREQGPHVCTHETCPEPGNYYVTAVDGPAFFLMAGPYTAHAAALADVDMCRAIANDVDGRAWFMGWGTVQWKTHTTPGKLNQVGLLPCTHRETWEDTTNKVIKCKHCRATLGPLEERRQDGRKKRK